MTDTDPTRITSPTELETKGSIRIRGRILGSARLGKKAGVTAIAILVMLLSAIIYGVSLNRAPAVVATQQLAKPEPPPDNAPWWQNQSDAAHSIAQTPSTRHLSQQNRDDSVPDLNDVSSNASASPVVTDPLSRHGASDVAISTAKFPVIPPIEAQSTNSDAVPEAQVMARRSTVSASDQRESLRQAALMSTPLVSGVPLVLGGPTASVERTSATVAEPSILAGGHAVGATAAMPAPTSPFEIEAGTVIPASLVTAIDSDLPGLLVAQVRQTTFDSATGQFVLIPQGAKLIGTYDARIAYGQDRLLVSWTRILYPDGSSVNLEGMAGGDNSGRSGFDAQVDNHTRKLFQGALLLSIIGAGAQLSQPQQSATNGSPPNVGQVIAGSMGSQLGNVSTQVTQRQLSVPPNLRVPAGYQFNVIVDHDIVLARPYTGP